MMPALEVELMLNDGLLNDAYPRAAAAVGRLTSLQQQPAAPEPLVEATESTVASSAIQLDLHPPTDSCTTSPGFSVRCRAKNRFIFF